MYGAGAGWVLYGVTTRPGMDQGQKEPDQKLPCLSGKREEEGDVVHFYYLMARSADPLSPAPPRGHRVTRYVSIVPDLCPPETPLALSSASGPSEPIREYPTERTKEEVTRENLQIIQGKRNKMASVHRDKFIRDCFFEGNTCSEGCLREWF